MPLNCRHAVLIVKPWLGVPKSTIYYERPSETPYWPITSLASCMQGPSQRTKVYTLTHHYIRSGKKKMFPAYLRSYGTPQVLRSQDQQPSGTQRNKIIRVIIMAHSEKVRRDKPTVERDMLM